MRVGVHCLCTYPSYKGGTNSFTLGLLDGLARVGDAHELTVFVRPWNRELFARYENVPHFDLVEIAEPVHRWRNAINRRLPGRIRPRLAPGERTADRIARDAAVIERAADVLYVPYVPPSHFFPLPDLPTVYSIHDIQQVHYPEFFTPEELAEREAAFAASVAGAAVVQASSRFMARDFCAHFPELTAANVEVIPEGVDIDLFATRRPGDDVRERYSLPEAFLFTPAQLWHHKNHLTLLRALRRLRDRGLVLPLVLTGAAYNAAQGVFDFIADNGLAEQVLHLGLVPFEDVVVLHQSARFLVTASLYESSSLTILEAAAAGTPIVAGRIPPHEEMAEHLEMRLFEPTDDEELARVLEEAWTDKDGSSAQAAANRSGVRRYSWDNAAVMYLQLFERIRSGAPAPVPAGGRA